VSLQHLDKPLPDDTGSAENPDRKLTAHSEYLNFTTAVQLTAERR
jgi:hypothetical protein